MRTSTPRAERAKTLFLVFVFAGIAFAQTWVQQGILTASNKASGDEFGRSVSLTDNYALVGAPLADSGGITNAGAAYVFVRSGTTWTEQAILTASNKAGINNFGVSVSLTDNYALVGALYANPGGIDYAGAAYLFVRSGTTWTEQAILTASNKAAGDWFGVSVSLTDNYALVGSLRAFSGGFQWAGAAYIFVRAGTTWTEQAILTASNKAQYDYFGVSVSLTNDNTALIGANGNNNPRTYAFTRQGTTWTESAISNTCCPQPVTQTASYKIQGEYSATVGGLTNAGRAIVSYNSAFSADVAVDYCLLYKPSTSREPPASWFVQSVLTSPEHQANDYFGASAAISADYAIVGAPGFDTGNQATRGAAFVFSRSASSWICMQKLVSNVTNINNCFGCSVAITNTLAAVGSIENQQRGETKAGNAHIFTRIGTVWSFDLIVTPSFSPTFSLFGLFVYVDRKRLVVQDKTQTTYDFTRSGSSWNQTSNAPLLPDASMTDNYFVRHPLVSTELGRYVVIYANPVTFNTNAWVRFSSISAHDGAQDDMFGSSATLVGDLLVIGAPMKANSESFQAGAVYVYRAAGLGVTFLQKLVSPNSVDGALFGSSVSLHADSLVVGAPFDYVNDLEMAGLVYHFSRSGDLWIYNATISAEDHYEYHRFGHSVSILDNFLCVGSPGDVKLDTGLVYVFTLSSTIWIQHQKILPPSPRDGMEFGIRVHIQGSQLLVQDNDLKLIYEFTRVDQSFTFDQIQRSSNGTLPMTPENQDYRVGVNPLDALQKGTVYLEYNSARITPSRKSSLKKKK